MHSEHDAQALSQVKSYEASHYLGLDSWDNNRRKKALFRPLRRLVQRNLLVLGLPTAIAALITYGLVATGATTYLGTFQLLVEPTSENTASPDLMLTGASPLPPSPSVDYSTLIQVLTSPAILADLLPKINTQYPKVSLSRLSDQIDVERIEKNPNEKTKILKVMYESSDPKEILYVLNQLASGYLRFGLDDRKAQIGGGVALIEQQLPALKQRINTLNTQLQLLEQKHRMSDVNSTGTQLTQQARDLQSQGLAIQRDLAAQKNLYNNLQRQLGLSPQDLIKASSLTESPTYQGLQEQLRQVNTQIALGSNLAAANPQLVELKEQRKNIETLLKQEFQKLAGNAAVPQFQNSIQRSLSQQAIDTLNQIQVLETRAQALTQAGRLLDQQMKQFPVIKRQTDDLKRQLEIDNAKLRELELKRENLRVEAAQKTIPWRIIAQPSLIYDNRGNLVTTNQQRWLRVLLGALGGLAFGFGCALIGEKRRNSIDSIEDLQEDLRIPVLGTFPILKSDAKKDATGDIAPQKTRNRWLSSAAEALYTNLCFLPIEPGLRSLSITSVGTREGKTTAVVELARAAAEMGQRVLVVDANLVMPRVHSELEVPNFEGLYEVLTKGLDPQSLIQRSPQQQNLYVLPSGQGSPSAHKLVASQQMHNLMSQLQTMFDLVLYDTPYLKGYSDANFLSRYTDAVLMVVQLGHTQRSELLHCLKRFQTSRIHVLGAIANGVKLKDLKDIPLSPVLDGAEDEFEVFRTNG
jgi:capsular exopolysaccharide synthesis family protein